MTSTVAYITATLSGLFLAVSVAIWANHWQYTASDGSPYDGRPRRMLVAANTLTGIALVLAVLTGAFSL